MSTSQGSSHSLILVEMQDGVTTLTMNNPARLNGWTQAMMEALKATMGAAANDDETRVLVLTGTDPYYCAGVNLSGAIQLAHPRKMHAAIVKNNEALFNLFLDFPKPVLVAVNGPAIGASVTSAALCDGIIASQNATFSTPFGALGVPPEGCSSVQFARLMGETDAYRMLGPEGWRPNAQEALESGLVNWVVPHNVLHDEAIGIAKRWIDEGATRQFRGGSNLAELKLANERESIEIADAFLSTPFLKAQIKFLYSRKKWKAAAMFLAMLTFRPVWARLL